VAAQLKRLFLPNLPPPAERALRVVVLVGPTGVGKTTTIAKLAARSKLAEGRRVGLVTLDTFRIAAVDQLEKYARIIGVPLAVATDPVELGTALRTFEREGLEAVFVDSAGRSQRDELKMAELREFLGSTPGAEVHLVLSTTTQPRTLRSVAERFAGAGYHRVILTKLDETMSFGALLDALLALGKPISYLTDGQNVPDDIMPSDPDRLADLVLRPVNG
jgi:flagellar biosynthesis protein FlhF